MRTLLLVLSLVVGLQVFAIPARPRPIVVSQPDGTSLTVFMYGDESYHFFKSADGVALKKASDGSFHYAVMRDGQLVASDMLAHDAAGRTADEQALIAQSSADVASAITRQWTSKAKARGHLRNIRAAESKSRRAFGYPTSYRGKKKGLVILVNFADLSMKSGNTRQLFDNQFNKVGYSSNGHIGSVHDYFLDQSYGLFDLSFDVVGPVTLSKKYSYYGENDDAGDDLHPATMVAEACRLVDSQVNFADYDWDGDGEVDQVYVVYAGYGEHATLKSTMIWPHEWSFQEAAEYGDGNGPITLDKVHINTYAVSCELRGSSGSTMDGIGTACHEFSHCLGIPDFYDTSYNGGFGMDNWSLMDHGSYNGPSDSGEIPCGYTAYERMFAGWLTFTELSSPCNVTDMPCLADEKVAYVVYNDGNHNEFYLLENRQQSRWYQYCKGHGLLVTHVDYDEMAWVNDEPNNNAKHQRMSIIPADGSYGTYSSDFGMYSPTAAQLAGDPFPGTKKVTALTDMSHTKVGGKLFNKNLDGTYNMGKDITDIEESNAGLISFRFMGGKQIEAPHADDATALTGQGFTANWSVVPDALSYTLELTEVSESDPAESVIISENFSGFATVNTDGSEDISGKLDLYMQQKGWSGEKLFASPSRIKLGSSKYAGTLVTPRLTCPSTGNVTVRIVADPYGSDATDVTVSLVSASGIELASAKLNADGKMTTLNFADIDADFTVQITPVKRAYIAHVGVYDGTFTSDDFDDEQSFASQRQVDKSQARVVAKASAKRLIEGIKSTNYTFADLTPMTTYRYRVKAITSDGESAWSNIVSVTTTEPTAIDNIDASTARRIDKVYTIGGQYLGTAVPMTRGMYIIRYSNGEVRKVGVR